MGVGEGTAVVSVRQREGHQVEASALLQTGGGPKCNCMYIEVTIEPFVGTVLPHCQKTSTVAHSMYTNTRERPNAVLN